MEGQSPDEYKADRWGELKDSHNELVDFVFSIQPLSGTGLARSDSKLGRLLSVLAVGGGGTKLYPLNVVDASTGGVNKVRVVYGTIDSIRADEMSEGDDPLCVVDTTGSSGKVQGHVTIDADTGEVVSWSVSCVASITGINDATNLYFELGSYSISGSAITIAYNYNESLILCRNWFANPATYRVEG